MFLVLASMSLQWKISFAAAHNFFSGTPDYEREVREARVNLLIRVDKCSNHFKDRE